MLILRKFLLAINHRVARWSKMGNICDLRLSHLAHWSVKELKQCGLLRLCWRDGHPGNALRKASIFMKLKCKTPRNLFATWRKRADIRGSKAGYCLWEIITHALQKTIPDRHKSGQVWLTKKPLFTGRSKTLIRSLFRARGVRRSRSVANWWLKP